MRDFILLFVHVIVTVARLAGPGGLRSVVAESALLRHQLLILNRGRKRAPNLHGTDRITAGLFTLLISQARILRSAIVLKPSTLLCLQNRLRKRKYRMLFSPQRGRRPGPKGPNQELIDGVVVMKRRNPRWGCPRIAQQIALAFGVEIDKDVVRRILSRRYRPESDSAGLFMANYKFAMNTITKRHLSRGIMRTLEGVAKPPKPPYSGRGILKPVLMVAETR